MISKYLFRALSIAEKDDFFEGKLEKLSSKVENDREALSNVEVRKDLARGHILLGNRSIGYNSCLSLTSSLAVAQFCDRYSNTPGYIAVIDRTQLQDEEKLLVNMSTRTLAGYDFGDRGNYMRQDGYFAKYLEYVYFGKIQKNSYRVIPKWLLEYFLEIIDVDYKEEDDYCFPFSELIYLYHYGNYNDIIDVCEKNMDFRSPNGMPMDIQRIIEYKGYLIRKLEESETYSEVMKSRKFLEWCLDEFMGNPKKFEACLDFKEIDPKAIKIEEIFYKLYYIDNKDMNEILEIFIKRGLINCKHNQDILYAIDYIRKNILEKCAKKANIFNASIGRYLLEEKYVLLEYTDKFNQYGGCDKFVTDFSVRSLDNKSKMCLTNMETQTAYNVVRNKYRSLYGHIALEKELYKSFYEVVCYKDENAQSDELMKIRSKDYREEMQIQSIYLQNENIVTYYKEIMG